MREEPTEEREEQAVEAEALAISESTTKMMRASLLWEMTRTRSTTHQEDSVVAVAEDTAAATEVAKEAAREEATAEQAREAVAAISHGLSTSPASTEAAVKWELPSMLTLLLERKSLFNPHLLSNSSNEHVENICSWKVIDPAARSQYWWGLPSKHISLYQDWLHSNIPSLSTLSK